MRLLFAGVAGCMLLLGTASLSPADAAWNMKWCKGIKCIVISEAVQIALDKGLSAIARAKELRRQREASKRACKHDCV